MKKIISLFQRNYDGDRMVRNEVVPGAEWVLAGEGVATRKYDGTCCLIRDGKLYKRYEIKPGGKPPANFEPANEVDDVTGKQQGWVPVGDGPEDAHHREGFEWLKKWEPTFVDGTYELVGPKVQGNPEGYESHLLILHGKQTFAPWDASRMDGGGTWMTSMSKVPTFDSIRDFLAQHDIEGLVWHHPDGRMVKIKGKDFGIKRGPKPAQS